MTVFTDSDLKRRSDDILIQALAEGEVRVQREDGETFIIRPVSKARSGLDVPGVQTDLTIDDIVAAVREGRDRG